MDDIFGEMHVKWSVVLTDRFGPEILTMLEIKFCIVLQQLSDCENQFSQTK